MIGEFKRLSKHSAIYGLSNILSRAVALVLLPLYTRYLNPADYGVLEILTATTVFTSIVLELGLGTAVLRAVLFSRERDEKVLFSTAFYGLTISSGVLFVILFLLAPGVARLLLDMPLYTSLLRIAFLTACLDAISIVPLNRLRMHEESIRYSAINVGRFAGGLLLNVYFIVVLGRGVEGLVIASALQSAAIALVLLMTLAKTLQLSFSSAALR
jgi:O-antigen/teichoic acid export membrane protein